MGNGGREKRGRRVFLVLVSPFIYQTVGFLCLRHWGSASPWLDVDYFSCGFFALTALLLLCEIRFNRSVFWSQETLREASGLTFDPATVRWGSLLALGDLAVFLDYGHWHLTPILRQTMLQTAGLAVYGCAVVGLMWTDTLLARHFQETVQRLMTTGPFGIVQHPRYISLLVAKVGFAMIFGSVFAWASLLASLFLIRRRIRLEEKHLHAIFGAGYGAYMEQTPRLIPGIY